MEKNTKHECEETPFIGKDEDLAQYKTLNQIAHELESADYDKPSGLTSDPHFVRLKALAAYEDETGKIPPGNELRIIVEGLREKDYQSLPGFMACNIAFLALKKIADNQANSL